MVFFDRRSGRSARRQQQSQSHLFPAPRRGLIRNDALAVPEGEGAEVMNNFFPTTQGARMRGGLQRHAILTGDVEYLAAYDSGNNDQLFAADGTSIYNITTPADPDVVPTADVTGQTSGDYSSVQFTTSGGTFLVMVNGADEMQLYDGTSWQAVNAGSSPISITGVTTSDLSFVWKFKSRLFFIQDLSLSFWYLPVDSVGGAAAEFPLGGVFQRGGTLLFGVTWSLDAGDGLDDVCAFVTTEGEIAVYQGTDPSSANTWSLVGVYQTGRPLGKNSWFRAGGDVAIGTDDAIIPISGLVRADRAAVQAGAITYPIEELWRETVDARRGIGAFNMQIWYAESLLVVGVPGTAAMDTFCLISNIRTGAWAMYTGWDVGAVEVFLDRLYIGGANNRVYEANVGGEDDDQTFSAVILPRFDTFGQSEEKQAVSCRLSAIRRAPVSFQLFCNSDWQVNLPTNLSADPDVVSGLWDVGLWDEALWDAQENRVRISEWRAVLSSGYSLSPGLQITSGRTTQPDIEVISLELLYKTGKITG